MKVSRAVLRGLEGSNALRLPDQAQRMRVFDQYSYHAFRNRTDVFFAQDKGNKIQLSSDHMSSA